MHGQRVRSKCTVYETIATAFLEVASSNCRQVFIRDEQESSDRNGASCSSRLNVCARSYIMLSRKLILHAAFGRKQKNGRKSPPQTITFDCVAKTCLALVSGTGAAPGPLPTCLCIFDPPCYDLGKAYHWNVNRRPIWNR